MPEFLSEPRTVTAVQFTYPPTPELEALLEGVGRFRVRMARHMDAIAELEVIVRDERRGPPRRLIAHTGDWLVRELDGELRVAKPEAFESAYSLAPGS